MTRALILCGVALAAAAAVAQALETTPGREQQLSAAIDQMQAGRGRDALKNLEALVKREPEFGLGRLVYTELRTTLAQAGPANAAAAAANESNDVRLAELAEEARLRLVSEKAVPPPGAVPANVLRLSDAHPYLVLVDLPRAHLYLFENKDGQLKVLRHHYAAMGRNGYGKEAKGDLRTPVGVYHVTDWLHDSKLPELYGAGAFPVSYPNPWDVFKRRTGSGIWLHGVPRDTASASRPPRSSEGCVTMANSDLLALKPYMRLGNTPVIFSDNVEWVQPDQLLAEREAWLNRIEEWRERWAAKDTPAYLEFYGAEFTTEGMNRAKFVEHKQRVNAAKKSIKIDIDDLDLFQYPGAGEPLILAEFTMDYRSDNYNSKGQKQQFWRQEKGGEWKIFREENR